MGGVTLNAEAQAEVAHLAAQIADLIAPEAGARAAFVRDFVHHVHETPDSAQELFTSEGWWGGEGSMAEFLPSDPDRKAPYFRLLVQFINLFEGLGVRSARARMWRDIFEAWLRAGFTNESQAA